MKKRLQLLIQSVKVMIQALELANKRGAFTLKESKEICNAVDVIENQLQRWAK